MATETTRLTSVAPIDLKPGRSLLRIYGLEIKSELLKTLRLPAYTLPTLAFPVMFYLLFGIAFDQKFSSGFSMAKYLLATYGAFGVIGAALFGFGVGVAVERGQGWMLLKRASPMPVGAYFAAKLLVSALFGTAIIALISILGATLGGVSLAPGQWLGLIGILIAGALPFSAFGLVLGLWAGPNSAPAVVNLIYLPSAFLSGLWIPIRILPDFIQRLAVWLPPYHYSQLALKVIGADDGFSASLSVLYLVVFTVICLGIATIGYRRDQGKTYG